MTASNRLFNHVLSTSSLLDTFRLFFGYRSPLNIKSIRLIETRMNLESHIGAITALDCIISRNLYRDNAISEHSNYGTIIKNLFDNNDSSQSTASNIRFSPYIYQSFNCFIAHKEKIRICLMNVARYVKDRQLLQLLFMIFRKNIIEKTLVSGLKMM